MAIVAIVFRYESAILVNRKRTQNKYENLILKYETNIPLSKMFLLHLIKLSKLQRPREKLLEALFFRQKNVNIIKIPPTLRVVYFLGLKMGLPAWWRSFTKRKRKMHVRGWKRKWRWKYSTQFSPSAKLVYLLLFYFKCSWMYEKCNEKWDRLN